MLKKKNKNFFKLKESKMKKYHQLKILSNPIRLKRSINLLNS